MIFYFACCLLHSSIVFFFFNDTATTEIYTLSLHDALPIFLLRNDRGRMHIAEQRRRIIKARSEEHTSELQSHEHLVCRLLLEKTNTCRRSLSRTWADRMLSAHSAEGICA